MNRNDMTYFKRITPELLESRFDGYTVPENIKQRAKLIMKRFVIKGLCDGMYVANCIAFDNGTGDGKGHFSEGEIKPENVDKIVKYLMAAYKCNIFPRDKEDLTEIIRTGTLSKERMIAGLKNSIEIRHELIRHYEETKDAFHREYVYGEIGIIKDLIKKEEEAA